MPDTSSKKFKTPAWSRAAGQDPSGGLNSKGRASAKAEGHNLKPPAPNPKTPKDEARRKSFCARSAGQAKMFPEAAKDPDSRLRKARRAWNCADGGAVVDDALRIAKQSRPDEGGQEQFLKEQLKGSAPQYDPKAGIETAKEAGRMAVTMTPPGAIADAAGYLGSPSALQNVRQGNYGTAAMQVAGALPGVGPLAKAAKIAEEARSVTNPIRAYHGSPKLFDKFDINYAGSTTDKGHLGRAHYLSTDPVVAEGYPHKYEVAADLRNPLKISLPDFRTDKRYAVREALGLPKDASPEDVTLAAKKEGFDGVVLDYTPTGYEHQEIAVFEDSPIDIKRRYDKGGPVWDKPRPKDLGEPKKLTPSQKASAKASAKAAGRPWPNMIDNMRAARRAGGGPVVEDALRLANERNNPPPPPERPLELSQQDAANAFPSMWRNVNPVVKYNVGRQPMWAETYTPGEEGDPNNPNATRPPEFPLERTGIEVYNPRNKGVDLGLELLHADPKAIETRNALLPTITKGQRDVLTRGWGDYDESIREKLSEQKAMENVVDAMERTYLANKTGLPHHQGPQRAIDALKLTGDQKKLLDKLYGYTQTGEYADGGPVINDALRLARSRLEAGGVPDDASQEKFLKEQLAGSAPQYEPSKDFPARAEQAVQTVDKYAGALNDLAAKGAGLPSQFQSPQGRSAREIVESAIPQDPNAVSKQAMQQWQGGDRLGAVETMAAGMPQTGAIKAYHGSPYLFDKFDISKIGTGEGAQAYGHGLYFAESEPVARSYRDALSGAVPHDVQSAMKYLDNLGYNSVGTAIANARLHPDWMKRWDVDPTRSKTEELAANIINKHISQPRGHMYEVEIAAEPHQLLDWDKPLSEQPHIAGAVSEKLGLPLFTYSRPSIGYAPGRNVYESLAHEKGAADWPIDADSALRQQFRKRAAELASESLREAGIPGIKYLDAGSRGAGEGSRNFVIFDPSLIDIKRRYAEGGEVDGALRLANAKHAGTQDAIRRIHERQVEDAPETVLREYYPSLKERIAASLMGDERPSVDRRRASEGLSDVAYYLPGAGEAIAGDQIGRSGVTGDYATTLRNLVGVIPGLGKYAANKLLPKIPERDGGRVNARMDKNKTWGMSLADGGAVDRDPAVQDALRVASQSRPDEGGQEAFLKEQLKGSAPQYDPQAGIETAKEAGRMAATMTPPGAIADAAGYLGSPSALQNVRQGNYGTAALQLAGALPGVGPLAKAAKIAEEAQALKTAASVAKKAPKEAEAVTNIAKEYQGAHQAPGPESGAPLWRMHGIYPDDLYSPQGFRYYADFGNPYDREGYAAAVSAKNQPSKSVTIFRAVPNDPSIKKINPGDWVTMTKDYAKEHGESHLGGDYRILKKNVRARDLFTSGDSIHEFGYHPQPRISDADLVATLPPNEAREWLGRLSDKARGTLRRALEARSVEEKAKGGAVENALRIARQDRSPMRLHQTLARTGYEEGGVPDEASQEKFLKEQLAGSAPQYDPEAGIHTAKEAGLMAAGMAPGAGIATAAGQFPTAEGGKEPSMAEDWRKGEYLSAGLKGLGAAGDVVSAVPVVGTAAGLAMKAPLAAKLAMAAAPMAKAAKDIAPVAKAAEAAAPAVQEYQRLINPAGFYSRAHEVAMTALPEQPRTWQEMRSLMMKQPGMREEEMYWSGLHPEAYDPSHKLTREEIAAQVEKNFPKVSPIVKGVANPEHAAAEQARIDAQNAYNSALDDYDKAHAASAGAVRPEHNINAASISSYVYNHPEKAEALISGMPDALRKPAIAVQQRMAEYQAASRKADELRKNEMRPMHEQYTVPGGKNYNERVLTHEYNPEGTGYTAEQFRHESHLGDINNPILHTRNSEREIPGRGKVWHQEEVQSDWAQQGREKGFFDTAKASALKNKMKDLSDQGLKIIDEFNTKYGYNWRDDPKYAQEYLSRTGAMDDEYNRMASEFNATTKGVPEAPHVRETEHWLDLAAKDTLKNAIEGGYDHIFITGGQEQAKRWSNELRKAVDNVRWETAGQLTSDSPKGWGFANDIDERSKIVYAKPVGSDQEHRFVVKPVEGQNGKTRTEVVDSSIPKAKGETLAAVVGNDLAKRIMAEESGEQAMKGYRMGSEGYTQTYERKYPSSFKKLIKGLDPQAKVEGGVMPHEEGDVQGTYIQITPKMREEYARLKQKHGAVFPAYRKGGSVKYSPGNTEFVSKALNVARRYAE